MTPLLSRLSLITVFFLSTIIQASEIPVMENMKKDQQLAGSRFLLVLISQPDCSYCRLIEDEILKPMQVSGRYKDRLLFRNLIINDGRRLTTVDGKQLSANKFAQRYSNSLTPTLLFIDPRDGSELTDRMIGINTVDMYGYYVDKAIDQAYSQLLSLH
ncbi:thioredoxin family protein [Amphritea japonica]|uniref:Thioredoxin-like fold domain-containing protein n=1 Tax=Amphritea japonica ATCC BAA-1530 TaxID=1278309 RepID=A0A7R6PBI6_9GAMM|nr:thioredoxin fold domain-containing protein [Amphritea japonica]BBB26453.1 conserved hypothetical protein [Amphritea japonica ATCC BAA-1530]